VTTATSSIGITGTITPIADRVVIRVVEAIGVGRAGLHIPDMARERPQQGEVVAVGPGRFDERSGQRIPMDVKAGDRVLYGKYTGAEVTVHGAPFLILREAEVLAIVG
jgi:chaperonin GroES